jgi:hypothetical protein
MVLSLPDVGLAGPLKSAVFARGGGPGRLAVAKVLGHDHVAAGLTR